MAGAKGAAAAAKPEEKAGQAPAEKKVEKKVELPEIPYPHCLYNEAGEAKIVQSKEEHEMLGAGWLPKAIREGREIQMPKKPQASKAE